jgi:plastocyanin
MSLHLDEPRTRISRRARIAAAAILAVAAAALLGLAADVRAPEASMPSHAMTMGSMNEASMARQVRDWYAAHPARGLNSSAVASDTFLVTNVIFNSDGKTATPIDTARIQTGQTILWQWVTGIHTTTNGAGATDPAVGTLWDQSITTSARTFSYTFTAPGTYPFFCRVHEAFDMRGVVIVTDPVAVPPHERPTPGLAFVAGPAPNPTNAGVRFQFSVPRAARARVELFDAAGQRVATILDRDVEPGVQSAAWDGRTFAGRNAAPGVYLLRVTAGRATASRSISVIR